MGQSGQDQHLALGRCAVLNVRLQGGKSRRSEESLHVRSNALIVDAGVDAVVVEEEEALAGPVLDDGVHEAER